uniref:FERM, ARHGEF and pleckstrin domain-containing protein 1 n=1 Tax=Cyprinus carpio TaxID=7962 RepID=A0A8C2DTY6_CYPCA
MVEQGQTSLAGQRLGAPETLGISTLEPGHKPPAMPPGHLVPIRVLLLDDSEEIFDISHRASGRVLFEMVCLHLNLIEGDYFGLEFQSHHRKMVWLDLLKPIRKQITRPKHTVLRFVVKFFPPDHSLLLEELTRYLFALQVRQDLASGRLTCSDASASLLVSHIIQSEIGDFEETQFSQTKHFLISLLKKQHMLVRYVLKHGSWFKLVLSSGRTQKQVIDYVKENEFKKLPFDRKHSRVQYNSSLSPLRSAQHQVPNQVSVFTYECFQIHTSHIRTINIKGICLRPVLMIFICACLSFSEVTCALVNGHAEDCRGATPSPLISPMLNDTGAIRTDDEEDNRRKNCPTDNAYCIAKELLCTERTYLKDLELITVGVLDKEDCVPEALKTLLSSTYEPLHSHHTHFLQELEERLSLWEGPCSTEVKGEMQRIGDLLLKSAQELKALSGQLQMISECVFALERACVASRRLECVCREFELQKVCYIPLNVFLLSPLHRLLHYRQILDRLCKHYPPTHTDYSDCRAALDDVCELEAALRPGLEQIENYQKLLELQKDLIGVEHLAVAGRQLIRLGCLSKLSGKGLQQRMFFLFNDVLLYSTRGITSANQFTVHRQLPLHGMTIRESEDEWGVPHSFTLMVQQQSLVVAACSESEMEKWMEDLKMAVDMAEECNGLTADLLSASKDVKSSGASEVVESEDDLCGSRTSLPRNGNNSGNTLNRGNTTAHVCWHRNTSVSMLDFSIAIENKLSGNLLRKFKNSNGWQKLWVVFTNFTLFFYKTHEDEYPLASLPLLGYSVTHAGESENIHKDHVFKLHFKSHIYYFRTESEYFFERWMTVIRSATVSASRTRYLNRTEPD